MGFFRSPGEQTAHENVPLTHEKGIPPKDPFHLAYLSYFIMGAGFLLPWNAFITAVDYFSYIYPGKQVDRVFSVAYMLPALGFLVLLLTFAGKSNARVRINLGLSLFLVSLLVVPVMDVTYIKGQRGLDVGYFITVATVVICGIADALVQGSLIGSAGELPEQYMQAVVAGTAASVCARFYSLFVLLGGGFCWRFALQSGYLWLRAATENYLFGQSHPGLAPGFSHQRFVVQSRHLYLRAATEKYLFRQSHPGLAPGFICTEDCMDAGSETVRF